MIIETKTPLMVGDSFSFCPDLDRGANFEIINISEVSNKKVTVSFKWIPGGGRWFPNDTEEVFSLEVPEDFSVTDVECAWFGIPNVERFTM